MIQSIPYLIAGDTVAIVSPAKAIDTDLIENAKQFLESKGFKILLGEHCGNRHNYFSGTIEERRDDFQKMLDDQSVKAILCARGGYGCVQFIDELDWTGFKGAPKWIIGFSDITVFHQRILRLGYPSIHGTMPLNFKENSDEALLGLVGCVQGKNPDVEISRGEYDRDGNATGTLVGGNLSILYSLIGTDDQIDYEGTILFIEDLCEPLYHLDRIFHSMRKAGILDKINGLIVGGMTDMKDTEIPFGLNAEEIILSHVDHLKIPVIFDFPAGHINDNRPLKLGATVELSVGQATSLKYL